MDVLAVCPLLVAINEDASEFTGFITVSNQDYQIHIRLQKPGQMQGARIDCEWRLKELLRGYEDVIQQRLHNSSSLSTFLKELKQILERRIENVRSTGVSVPPPPKFYSDLIADIDSLGWDRLSYVDATFHELHVVSNDGKRCHTLKIRLHQQHPEKAPELHAELPVPFDFVWSSRSTLCDVYTHFVKCTLSHQQFWDQLDEVDANTWVLEPERPTRNATRRRIAIGKSASVQVEVDPRHPTMLPDIRFLGADHVLGPLKENLSRNIADWKCERSLLNNLQAVLQVEFPSLKNTKKEDFSVECGICYAYRLDGQIPDQVCEDSRCAQPFHRACLCEWLRALPSCRQSFNVVFGECPYCSKPITVKTLS